MAATTATRARARGGSPAPAWARLLAASDESPARSDALAHVDDSDYDLPVPPDYISATVDLVSPFRAFLPDGSLGEPYLPLSPRTGAPCSSARAWSEWRWTLAGGGFYDWDNQARIEGPRGPVQRLRDGRARARRDAGSVDAYVAGHRAGLSPLALLIYSLYFGLGWHVGRCAAEAGRSRGAISSGVRELRLAAGLAGTGARALRHPGLTDSSAYLTDEEAARAHPHLRVILH